VLWIGIVLLAVRIRIRIWTGTGIKTVPIHMRILPQVLHMLENPKLFGLLITVFSTFSCQRHRFLIMKQYSATLQLGEMDTDPVPDRRALVANPDSAK
jgi:hypothetical protein